MVVERFKRGLMGNPTRSMEDSRIEDKVACESPTQEASEEKVLLADLQPFLVIFWQRT